MQNPAKSFQFTARCQLTDFNINLGQSSCQVPTFDVAVHNEQLMKIGQTIEHLSAIASSHVLAQWSVLFYLILH